MLVQLDEAASRSAGALSLLAVSRENPDKLRDLLERSGSRKGLGSVVLIDDKGITSAYGLARQLPAAVLVGPGEMVGSLSARVQGAREIVIAAADTFIVMNRPASAMSVYDSMPEDWLGGPEKTLAAGYASVFLGNASAVRGSLERLAGGSSPLSSEAHAALGFLLFRQGNLDKALSHCARASGSGFADYVAGMIRTSKGEWEKAAILLTKAAKGSFMFGWQKALAFNMAARAAEVKGNENAALEWYKKAFSVAPLSTMINANLLCHHWQTGTFTAAEAYAEVISSLGTNDPITATLLEEFRLERAFAKDRAAKKQLEQKLQRGPGQRAASPRAVLVADFVVMDCVPELNCLPLASAALLRRSLESESNGALVTVRRPEMLEVKKRLNMAGDVSTDPLRLAKIARALSADTVMFGEIATYEGNYLLNLRTGDVSSGAIIAVASERFAFLEELPIAIQKSAKELTKKIETRSAGR
jgi:tetratricopeptide (TPR) repeat protein